MIYLVLVAIVVIALFFVIRKSGTADTTIKVTEKKYWDTRKNYPGLDEHQYLAAVYKQRMKARARLTGTENQQEAIYDMGAYSYTLLFSVLPPPDSIRALALHIVYQEDKTYIASNPQLIAEYNNLVGNVQMLYEKNPEEFYVLYKKRNPNSASYFEIGQQAQEEDIDHEEDEPEECEDEDEVEDEEYLDVISQKYAYLKTPNDPNAWISLAAYCFIYTYDYDSTISNCEKALDLNPESADAFFWRGRAKAISRKFEDKSSAIEDFSRCIEITPNNYNAYYQRGKLYCDKGDYRDAIDDFAKVISMNPNNYKAYRERGYANYYHGNKQKALADFNSALELKSQSELYSTRGDVKIDLGDTVGGIEDHNKAIQLRPNEDNYRARAFAQRKIGDYKSAINDFTHAIENKSVWSIWEEFHYYWRGKTYSEIKDYEHALNDYDKAIALNDRCTTAYIWRGDLNLSLGNYSSALEDYNQALSISPDATVAFLGRGKTKYKLCDYIGAISDFNSIIELEPNCAIAYHNRGTLNIRLGNKQLGEADITKAKELSSQNNKIDSSMTLE